MAAANRTLGLLLPCHSDPKDEHDALLFASRFSIPTERIDLSAAYDAMTSAVQPAARAASPIDTDRPGTREADIRARVPLANIKPRLRMTALYYVANSLGYLVAGTGNRSESSIGYFTKFGDGGADLMPLAKLLKSQVRALATELRIPAEIVDRTPSAGLWSGQYDEDEMGFTYVELEKYLKTGADGVSPALAMKIERMVRASDHKRELPAVPDFD